LWQTLVLVTRQEVHELILELIDLVYVLIAVPGEMITYPRLWGVIDSKNAFDECVLH
jgi:hypothetical protein